MMSFGTGGTTYLTSVPGTSWLNVFRLNTSGSHFFLTHKVLSSLITSSTNKKKRLMTTLIDASPNIPTSQPTTVATWIIRPVNFCGHYTRCLTVIRSQASLFNHSARFITPREPGSPMAHKLLLKLQ